MTSAVITVVHGRPDHLDRQIIALESIPDVDRYVVVAMDDSTVAHRVARSRLPAVVVEVPTTPLGLPLAAARNRGAEAALHDGADLLVFLDADCIPVPTSVSAYESAAAAPATAGMLLCGPVSYLPEDADLELPAAQLAAAHPAHPARPAPAAGAVALGADHALFWSLSFALTDRTWRRIGGFYEGYVGYGGEDTDFAAAARREGVGLAFVGGADAVHQFHPTANPPVQHLRDIVRNANLYRDRWGTLPMTGWLDAFERDGLIERDEQGFRLTEGALDHRG